MKTCGTGIAQTHLHTNLSMTLINNLFTGLSMDAGLILEACSGNLWSQYNTNPSTYHYIYDTDEYSIYWFFYGRWFDPGGTQWKPVVPVYNHPVPCQPTNHNR